MGRRLADIEEHLEYLVGVRVNNRHAQCRPGEMAGPFAVFGKLLQGFLIGDCNGRRVLRCQGWVFLED